MGCEEGGAMFVWIVDVCMFTLCIDGLLCIVAALPKVGGIWGWRECRSGAQETSQYGAWLKEAVSEEGWFGRPSGLWRNGQHEKWCWQDGGGGWMDGKRLFIKWFMGKKKEKIFFLTNGYNLLLSLPVICR